MKAKEVGEREPDGKCPLCGGEVADLDKRYACSNWKRDDGGCLFVIWKNMFGRAIDKTIVDELLTKGRTAEPLDLISKAGKEYSAYLKIELGQVKLEFDNSQRPYASNQQFQSGQSTQQGQQFQQDAPYDGVYPEDMPPPSPIPGQEDFMSPPAYDEISTPQSSPQPLLNEEPADVSLQD
jgi:DNA topoisomerase-3